MIYDKVENALLYCGISPSLAEALSLLRDSDLVGAADGRHAIDGDRLYYLAQRYTTRPAEKCNLESHRKYIDVQWIVSGEEVIRVSCPDDLTVLQPYEDVADRAFYHPHEKMSRLLLKAGTFAVFFPNDAHMPCLQADGPGEVHKIVFKVLIDKG